MGSLIIGIESTVLTQDDRRRLAHASVSGVILFARNYESPEQLAALTHSIKAIKPLLITVDQEGGRVQRFDKGFTTLKAQSDIGILYDKDPEAAMALAYSQGKTLAAELKAVGVDLSFTPVLDLNKGVSDIIGSRAFHRDPHVVVVLAKALVAAMKSVGLQAVGKHFPGHGSVAPDTHQTQVVDARTWQEIVQSDLIPFAAHREIGLDAIMASHIVYSQVDDCPASFSKIWLKQILREQLDFEGLIFSDDLGMQAAQISHDPAEVVRLACEAGCDRVLLCNGFDVIDQVLKQF